MPRVPQSHNNTTPVEKFDDTAYDAVELVAQNIEEVIAAAGGVDVMNLYLGAFENAPTEGRDGAPLVAGNFYLNTTDGNLQYYDDDPGVWVVSDADTVVQAAQQAQAARDSAIAAMNDAIDARDVATNAASAASTSEANAATSESNASTSEANANTSANNAANSETAAALSESNASTSETNAANSASAASSSETNASASESAAADSAVSAAASANAAEAAFDNFDDKYLGAKNSDPLTDNDGQPLQVGATYWNIPEEEQRFWSGAAWDTPSVTAEQAAAAAIAARDDAEAAEANAALSEAAALASANAAGVDANNAGNSATAAATSESNASDSEDAARASELAANASESNALQSANNAATSESNAAGSASAAATSASNASTSETNAGNSASIAQTARDDALQAETDAQTAETNAAASAAAAATSETNASTSETNAATSETNAANSETAAALSETNAATSETNAAASAAAAASSAGDAIWKVHTRGQAELDQMRQENERIRASSGFDHYGQHVDDNSWDSVNEGMWAVDVDGSVSSVYTENTFHMGLVSDNANGDSVTQFPRSCVAGVVYDLMFNRYNPNREGSGDTWSRVKLPAVERGTRIFSKVQDARGTGKWNLDFRYDIDPKYGNVAPNDSIAVSRAFEGLVQNGDFRSGDNGAWAKGTADGNTITIATGLLTINKVGAHWSYIEQDNCLTIGDEYYMEFWSDDGTGKLYVQGGQYPYVRKGWNRIKFTADSVKAQFQVVDNGVYYIRNLCFRPVSEEVVVARHDIVCGEHFLEEVSLANPYVYPKGNIQDSPALMNGIVTSRSNRPDSYYAVYDGDTPIYMEPRFGEGNTHIDIPTWVAGTGSTFKCKFVYSPQDANGEHILSDTESTHEVWVASDDNTIRFRTALVSVTLNGVSATHGSTVVQQGVEYELEVTNLQTNEINRLGANFNGAYHWHGEIWDVELTDNTDPTNSRFYPVRKYQADGDVTLTNVEEALRPELLNNPDFSDGANGWEVGVRGNTSVSSGEITCSTTVVAGVTGNWFGQLDALPTGADVEITVEVESVTGDWDMVLGTGVNSGISDGLRISGLSVGTNTVIGNTGAKDSLTVYNYQDAQVGDSIVVSSVSVSIINEGTLVGFPTDAWEILSGTAGGGSVGLGVDFWAASDQEKIDMVSDHSNNIFMLADGRVVQWRMRQRTFRGYGNGDWYNTDSTGDAVGFQSVPYLQPAVQGINDSVNDYFIFGEDAGGWYGYTNSNPIHDDPAVFKAGISGVITEAAAVNGECYLHVWGRCPRLNVGAYHPSHNPRGTSQVVREDWSGWSAWETAGASPTRGKAGCFQDYRENVDGLIDTSAPVGSNAVGLSGRRDGKFFDVVYAGGFGGINDDRLTTEDGETLTQRAYAKALDGSFRGQERQQFWRINRNVSPDSSSSVIYMFKAMGVPDRDDIVGGAYANELYNVRGRKCWVKVVETGGATLTTGTVTGVWYECDIMPHPQYKHIILNPNTGTSRWIDSGNSNTLKLDIACAVYVDENNNSHTVSGLKNQIDVIGAADDVTGRADVSSGWEGNWIGPSKGTGSYNWLHRIEFTSNMASDVMIILQAGGTTHYTRPIDQTRNRVTSVGTSGDVGIIDYNTKCYIVEDFATRKYSIGEYEIDHVYATAHNNVERGGLLREAFLGITDAGYGSEHPHSEYRGMRRKTYLSSRLNASSGTREYEPVHSQVGLGVPGYNTQAMKMVMHPFATTRKVGLNFVMNELRWVGTYASIGVIDVNDTNQADDGVGGQLYRVQGTWNGILNFKLLKCLNGFAASWSDAGWLASGVDGEGRTVFKYATNPSGTPYLREFGTRGDFWGDRGTIWVPDLGIETFDDELNTTVMAAQMILTKPIGYTKNIARVGEQLSGVDY